MPDEPTTPDDEPTAAEEEVAAAEGEATAAAGSEGAAGPDDDLQSPEEEGSVAPEGPDDAASPPDDSAVAEEGGAGEASDDDLRSPEEEDASPAPAIAPEHEAMLAVLQDALGDGIVAAASNHGDLIVRVRNDAWRQAAQVAHDRLDCEYLSFLSAVDWQPRPMPPVEDPGAPSFPAQPEEVTYGVTGSAGRFQVFACVESTERKRQVIFKTDLDEADLRVASWVQVYAGADWHERECWEMFGITFEGHPHLRHLYLPSEFEGHPLRKDFPLLAREVKPWPGLVDVETMPEDVAADEEGEAETADATSGAQGGDES